MMSDIEILMQLKNGNYLDNVELLRVKMILYSMNLDLKGRLNK